jgi:hypothetical protein
VAFASRCAGRGSAARPLTSLSSGRDALLEGPILGLPGLIEEKPAEQARAGAGSRSGQRALLGRGHGAKMAVALGALHRQFWQTRKGRTGTPSRAKDGGVRLSALPCGRCGGRGSPCQRRA